MTYELPKPLVDPFWAEDDKQVTKHRCPKPAGDLDLLDAVVEVAMAVDYARMNASFTANNNMAEQLGSYDGVVEGWYARTPAGPRFNNAAMMAKYVIDDRPCDMHLMVDAWLSDEGAKPNVPVSDYANFHRGQIAREWTAAALPMAVNPTAFFEKYRHSTPRPQQVIAEFFGNELPMPLLVMQTVGGSTDVAQVVKDPGQFTLVPNTMPSHWSYPAMHSTNAGAALMRAAALWNIEPDSEHVYAIRRAMAQNGIGRTLLGVHTMQDNLAGFALGQAIAYDWLVENLTWLPDLGERLKPFFIDYGVYNVRSA